MRGEARELVFLQVRPYPILGVELGRVAGKAVDLQPRVLLQVALDELRAVVGTVVPEDHDWPPTDVTLEMVEDRDHLRPSNGPLPRLEVETTSRCDPPDGRHLWPSTLMDQHRGLAHRSPGLRAVRDQGQAALVYEDDNGTAPPRFFFQRGQEWRFQLATFARSFSRAWREGRCHE